MECLEARQLYEYVQQRSLTHMTFPDIYMRIVWLCIGAYHHQSVRNLRLSQSELRLFKGLGLPSGVIITSSRR